MAKTTINNIKLGVFVIVGMAFLVLLLYMIGKNQNLFGKTFLLKAKFENVHGLMPGNNVRFGGIDAGTVKEIVMIDDTTIEVTMMVKTKMKGYIHKNANVTIATDGLMGNKLINIEPIKNPAPLVEEGDVLQSAKVTSIDVMLKTLGETNNDIAAIAKDLKSAVQRFNNSSALWDILNDKTLPANLRASLINVRSASERINNSMGDFNSIVADVKNGKGSVGTLLKDTGFAKNLNETILKIKKIGNSADTLALHINGLITTITTEVESGKGPVNALLKDSSMVNRLNKTLSNVEKGTAAFNDNMEAIKHSFLFRGYFKRLEKEKQKSTNSKTDY
jgi:phospholipid/cholesterol/gamma-HCH transport system substrate-binding protein